MFAGVEAKNHTALLETFAQGGFAVTSGLARTPAEVEAPLQTETWDLVLCHHGAASATARETLNRVRALKPEVPFIVVCDAASEAEAVALIRHGAQDCVPLDNLTRLLPVVERELREAAGRRARRRAEVALRQSGIRFRQIVETAQEGIWMLDLDWRTTYVNRQMAALTGIEPAAAYGMRPHQFLRDESLALFTTRLQELTAHTPTGRFDCRMARRDGRVFVASIALNTIVDDRLASVGFLAMVTDVTESRKLQEQLMISDRMASVGTLAAGIAHEINNPLAVILANLTLMVDRLGASDARPGTALPSAAAWSSHLEELRESLEAAERVKDIARDLKVFSRTSETTLEPVDVRPVIESSLRMAWNELRHRAKVVRRLNVVPAVRASESRLGQVLLNLLVNAAQSLPEGKADVNEIEVFTEPRDGGQVVIGVRDTGSGMSPEVQRRLFTPFFTTKPIGVGTGLGLSICHRIIDSFGGRMEVESVEGRGSTFRVILPINEQPRAAAAPAQGTPPPIRRGRVLVVDDEPLVARAVSRCLSADHEVAVCTSAREGLTLLREGKLFDVILCDLMMPDVSGMDFYRELEQLQPDLLPRVMFMTGGAFTPRARAFLEVIPNPRIDKPFDHLSMRRVVADHLRKLGTSADASRGPLA